MGQKAQSARSKVAAAIRLHRGDEAIEDAYRNLAAANINDYIEKVVANAPPLTREQRETLARLLLSGDESG